MPTPMGGNSGGTEKRPGECPSGKKWSGAESNCRHVDFQSTALPTELPDQSRFATVGYSQRPCSEKHLSSANSTPSDVGTTHGETKEYHMIKTGETGVRNERFSEPSRLTEWGIGCIGPIE